MMDEHAGRRRFLMNVTALGAAGGVSAAIGAQETQARDATPQMMAAAETQPRDTSSSNRLPRIHLIVSAGTLPSVGKTRMDLLRYRESGIPRLTGAQLLEPLPEVASVARVTVEQGPPPDNTTYDALRKLSMRISELLHSPDVDGVVYIQGTNTLEETAYFYNLTVRSDKPVVVTGAQRPYNGLSTDGPINLLDAVRVAASPESRGKGTVVVLNGEINGAREVTKTDTYHVQTFRSRGVGILGYADPDKIEYYRMPNRRHTLNSEFDVASISGSMPYVGLIYIHTGTRPGEADALVKAGAKGLVIAGSGAGSPGNVDNEVQAIAKNRSAVVVQSTRVGEGRIVRHNNWYWPGYVVADTLSPQKAALLLSLALTRTSDPDQVQRYFDEY
jgi:L-asparaginase type II